MFATAQEFSPNRESVTALLNRINSTRLQAVFKEPWFNKASPSALEFLVRYHGDAHSWPELSAETKAIFQASLFFKKQMP